MYRRQSFVLFLGHLFQRIDLAVLGFDDGAVDDNERVTGFYPFAFLYKKGVDASRKFSADTYLCGLYLPLQHHGLPAHK